MEKMQKLAKHNSGLSFSEDMMSEIFLWLPLKSLIRFKRLSKRWYFLISDQHNNSSYFRRNYLSTLSTRRRNRIVGSDDNSAIMAGFFYRKPIEFGSYRKPIEFGISYDLVGFLPNSTCTHESTTTENPFFSSSSSLVESSVDEFLSARLHEDEESYPPLHPDRKWSLDEMLVKFSASINEGVELNPDECNPDERKIFLAASSNGFLLFTLFSGFSHSTDYLLNPLTKEWLALPQLQPFETGYILGFVCKGDYPSLDLVEYTIVRLSLLEEQQQGLASLLFLLFSNASTGDHHNEWSEYRVSCKSLAGFDFWGQQNSVIVSSSGGSLILFLVKVRITETIAIVAIDLNVGDKSLKMFETPGPNRGKTVYDCADYIREFDDGLIHYVRFCCSTDFEFWVLNTESGEWYLKHRATLKAMMMTKEGYPWTTDVEKWNEASMFPKPYETISCYHIHSFHPMNPNLIFLTLYGRFVCYNIKTGILELVFDFEAQNMMDDYNHFVYQWPCWPPLL